MSTNLDNQDEKVKEVKIHFVGVGGVGMYSLFRYFSKLGCACTGSDANAKALFLRLEESGARVRRGHSAEAVHGADLVVYTHAVGDGNVELAEARALGIPCISRAELLGRAIDGYGLSVGVCGSHGKSTVCAMLYHVLTQAGEGADCICGANLGALDEPCSFVGSDTLVYEACEYKDSFLHFHPTVSLALNLELDHVDYFKDIEMLKDSFVKALSLAHRPIINCDDENLCDIIDKIDRECVLVGSTRACKYRIQDISENSGKYTFIVAEVGGRVAKIELDIYGRFNVSNAAMSYAAARELGLSPERAALAISSFTGIERRLERIGEYKGREVYYDYAHHPTEIREGIIAISERTGKRPTVIFRPHTYSRTSGLFDGFCRALSLAERALILDIDAIRESNTYSVSSHDIAREIGESATRVTENDVVFQLDGSDSPIIIMGAGDTDRIKEILKGE